MIVPTMPSVSIVFRATVRDDVPTCCRWGIQTPIAVYIVVAASGVGLRPIYRHSDLSCGGRLRLGPACHSLEAV